MTRPNLEGNRVGERQGVADVSDKRDRQRVSGDDRVNFLHGQCTNDFVRLAVGESCCAAFLNAKGRMRGAGQSGLA
jgi:folate-binding Fe-S cluster repair protein YgfZ